nr:RNA-directed DNA polymerase, eukaryota [Tanacetum cinerariifolium]
AINRDRTRELITAAYEMVRQGIEDRKDEIGVASAVKDGVKPSVVNMMVEKKKICSFEDTTVLESFSTLTTSLLLRLVMPLVDSIRAISERLANIACGFFLGKNVAYLVVAYYTPIVLPPLLLYMLFRRYYSSGIFFNINYVVTSTAGNAPGKSSYANITSKPSGKKVNVRTLFTPEGNGIAVVVQVDSIRAISERLANIACGFFLGKNVAYLVVAYYKEYRPVPKKSTASSSVNKKKGVEPTIEVSNSNPFNVLNSVENDVEFGTNRGTTNLVNNGATSSGSSFMNVDNSSSSTTLIIEKIRKFEDLLTNGQAILVDKAGDPLKNVEFPGEYESEDEVASVDNDMARSMAYERVGFGTQSLLEQWRIRMVSSVLRGGLFGDSGTVLFIMRCLQEDRLDKSPGSDGFTFGLYRRFWNIVHMNVVEAVKYFFKNGTFPRGGNSSFIALIPKMHDTKMDGPFILNELISWCKKKEQTMIFKVDFEKAYDSVRWDYLDIVMKKFGFSVGGVMSRINSWDDIVDKVKARLSDWKMKTLAIRGWLTLLKSVLGSIPIYHCLCIRLMLRCYILWSRYVVVSLTVWKVMRRRWYGRVGPARVIAAIRGDLVHLHILPTSSYSTTWMDIVRETFNLKQQGKLTIGSVRKLLDDKRSPKVSSKTRWVKPIPIKVNVFEWKVGLNKLPTRLNLSMRGLEIGSISCPICGAHVESTSHLFFSCSMVKDVLRKISLCNSLGNSGGILCIWEATVFKKDNVTVSDNFIAIYGTWLPSQWNGYVIMMGDFNEVRSKDERCGSWFNPSSSRSFDQFIASSGLVDVKMEG